MTGAQNFPELLKIKLKKNLIKIENVKYWKKWSILINWSICKK